MTNQQIAEAICERAPSDYGDLIDAISDEMLNTYNDTQFGQINDEMLDKGLDPSEWCKKKRPT